MFLVDDEIDQVSAPGWDNEEKFNTLYDEVMGFVGGSLRVAGKSLSKERSKVEAVESFRGIGEKLVDRYTPGKWCNWSFADRSSLNVLS